MSKLFIIPTTISNVIDHNVILSNQLAKINHLNHFIVETAKIGRLHIKQLNLSYPIQEILIKELNKHSVNFKDFLEPLFKGNDVGLISDCGFPAIADPGCKIIRLTHIYNFKVVPLGSGSSIILALVSSGLNGQNFAFNGYLPIELIEKKLKLIELQNLIFKNNQTQIFIETPYRNENLLNVLLNTLDQNIRLSLAIDLLQENQEIISKPIKEWKNIHSIPSLKKREVVFAIGKDE